MQTRPLPLQALLHDSLKTKEQLINERTNAVKALEKLPRAEENNKERIYLNFLLGNYSFVINECNAQINQFQEKNADPEIYYLLASSYLNEANNPSLDKAQKIIDIFNKAITLNPHFAIAYNARALIHAKNGNYDQAIEDFEHAINSKYSSNTDKVIYYLNVCEILSRRKKGYGKSAQKPFLIQAANNFEKAAELHLRSIDATNKVSALINLTHTLSNQTVKIVLKNILSGTSSLNKVFNDDSRLLEATKNELSKRKYERRLYTQAKELAKSSKLFVAEKLYAQLITSCEEGGRRNKFLEKLYKNHASICEKLNLKEKAEQSYSKIFALNDSLQFKRVSLLEEIGNFQAAIDLINSLIDKNKNESLLSKYYTKRANIYFKMKEYNNALKDADYAIKDLADERGNDYINLLFLRNRIHFNLFQFEEAQRDLWEGVKLCQQVDDGPIDTSTRKKQYHRAEKASKFLYDLSEMHGIELLSKKNDIQKLFNYDSSPVFFEEISKFLKKMIAEKYEDAINFFIQNNPIEGLRELNRLIKFKNRLGEIYSSKKVNPLFPTGLYETRGSLRIAIKNTHHYERLVGAIGDGVEDYKNEFESLDLTNKNKKHAILEKILRLPHVIAIELFYEWENNDEWIDKFGKLNENEIELKKPLIDYSGADRKKLYSQARGQLACEQAKRALKDKNNYVEAIQSLTHVLNDNEVVFAIQPNLLADLKLQRARLYTKTYDYNKATIQFDDLASNNMKNKKAYKHQAYNFIKTHKYDLAIKAATHSILIDSKYGPAYAQRAKANYLLKNYNEAENDLKLAIKLSPNFKNYFLSSDVNYSLNNVYQSVEDFKQGMFLLQQKYSDNKILLKAKILSRLSKSPHKVIISYLKEMIKIGNDEIRSIFPDYQHSFEIISSLFEKVSFTRNEIEKIGDKNKAIQSVNKAIEDLSHYYISRGYAVTRESSLYGKIFNRFFADFYDLRADLYYQIGDKNRALKDSKEALTLNKNLDSSRNRVMRIYEELKDYDSVSYYRFSLSNLEPNQEPNKVTVSPEEEAIQAILSNISSISNSRKKKEVAFDLIKALPGELSLVLFKKAMQKDTVLGKVFHAREYSLFKENMLKKIDTEIKNRISHVEANAKVVYSKAHYLKQGKKYQDALDVLDTLGDFRDIYNKSSAIIFYKLKIEILIQLGKYNEVIFECHQLSKLDPQSAWVCNAYATAYNGLKNPETAIQYANAGMGFLAKIPSQYFATFGLSAELYLNRAKAAKTIGNTPQAIKDYAEGMGFALMNMNDRVSRLNYFLDVVNNLSNEIALPLLKETLKNSTRLGMALPDTSINAIQARIDKRDQINATLNAAIGLSKKGKVDEAASILLKLIEECKTGELALNKEVFSRLYKTLSYVYSANSDGLEDAIKICNIALEFNPEDKVAYNTRAFSLCELGKVEEAMSDIQIAINLDPNFAPSYANRSRFNKELGKLNEAKNDIERFLILKLKSIKSDADAKEILLKTISLETNDVCDALVSNALNEKSELGKLVKGRFKKELREELRYRALPTRYSNMAIDLIAKGKIKEALDILERLEVHAEIEKNSRFIGSLNKIKSHAYFKDNKYAEAIVAIDIAMKNGNINHVDLEIILERRALANCKLGKFDDALNDYTKLSALYPDKSKYHFERGKIYYQQGKFDDSYESFNSIKDPNFFKSGENYFYFVSAMSKSSKCGDNIADKYLAAFLMASVNNDKKTQAKMWSDFLNNNSKLLVTQVLPIMLADVKAYKKFMISAGLNENTLKFELYNAYAAIVNQHIRQKNKDLVIVTLHLMISLATQNPSLINKQQLIKLCSLHAKYHKEVGNIQGMMIAHINALTMLIKPNSSYTERKNILLNYIKNLSNENDTQLALLGYALTPGSELGEFFQLNKAKLNIFNRKRITNECQEVRAALVMIKEDLVRSVMIEPHAPAEIATSLEPHPPVEPHPITVEVQLPLEQYPNDTQFTQPFTVELMQPYYGEVEWHHPPQYADSQHVSIAHDQYFMEQTSYTQPPYFETHKGLASSDDEEKVEMQPLLEKQRTDDACVSKEDENAKKIYEELKNDYAILMQQSAAQLAIVEKEKQNAQDIELTTRVEKQNLIDLEEVPVAENSQTPPDKIEKTLLDSSLNEINGLGIHGMFAQLPKPIAPEVMHNLNPEINTVNQATFFAPEDLLEALENLEVANAELNLESPKQQKVPQKVGQKV